MLLSNNILVQGCLFSRPKCFRVIDVIDIPPLSCSHWEWDCSTGGGYNTGIKCGYNMNHSERFCAGLTAIRKSIVRKFFEFCKTTFLRFRLKFTISAKSLFRGNDRYNTNHSNIFAITSITPKAPCRYNRPCIRKPSCIRSRFTTTTSSHLDL